MTLKTSADIPSTPSDLHGASSITQKTLKGTVAEKREEGQIEQNWELRVPVAKYSGAAYP